MRILIRADADEVRGGGHVTRCLTLADALVERGHTVIMQTNPDAIRVVPALSDAGLDDDGAPVDSIIVDHYGFAVAEERNLVAQRGARSLIVLDDLADRSHNCDLLVDSGVGRCPTDYWGLVPANATILTGPKYALVRRDVLALRASSLRYRRSRAGKLDRIVISFGLSNTATFVAAATAACAEAVPFAAIDLIVGPAGEESARAVAARYPGVRLHIYPQNYASLLARADLAIGAAGVSTFERCTLGLPSIVLTIASNQEANAAALIASEAADVVPMDSNIQKNIERALYFYRKNPEALSKLSISAARFCDGSGTSSLVDAIEHLRPAEKLLAGQPSLRPANKGDARLLWAWRNDPEARAQSRDKSPVTWNMHLNWLSTRLGSPNNFILIADISEQPVGVIRFEEGVKGLEVSITVSPLYRGRGLGRAILISGCERIFRSGFGSCIVATMHKENRPSRRLFASAGFVPFCELESWLHYRFGADADARRV